MIFPSDEAIHVKKETVIMYFLITGAIIKYKLTNYKSKTVQYLNLPKQIKYENELIKNHIIKPNFNVKKEDKFPYDVQCFTSPTKLELIF